MVLDAKSTWEKLSDIWEDTKIETLETSGNKYVLFSDIHLGNGGDADDFHSNENALVKALKHYDEQGYTLIFIGDIEELWQFDLGDIVKRYDKNIYSKIRKFGRERVYRIYGNHDYEWGGFKDPIKSYSKRTKLAPEALKLSVDGVPRFILVHGHQGSIEF